MDTVVDWIEEMTALAAGTNNRPGRTIYPSGGDTDVMGKGIGTHKAHFLDATAIMIEQVFP